MCIMEVRAGQRYSTIAQACHHNLATVEGDVRMFEEILRSRGDHEGLARLAQAKAPLAKASADMLALFGEYCAREVEQGVDHSADLHHDHGNERTLDDVERRAVATAKPYETR